LRVSNGALTAWRPAAPPPDGAIRILGIDLQDTRRDGNDSSDAVLYIETISGRAYKLAGEGAQAGWEEIDPSAVTTWPWECDLPPVVPPPSTVIDAAGASWCGEWHSGQVRYVVLEDGSVWQWKADRIPMATLLSMLCVSPIAGIGIGIVTFRCIAKLARQVSAA
jgi:hypothetical protein